MLQLGVNYFSMPDSDSGHIIMASNLDYEYLNQNSKTLFNLQITARVSLFSSFQSHSF